MSLNGCHNRELFKPVALMQDGWADESLGMTRTPVMVQVPFRMSQECNYSRDPMGLGQKDPRCKGCKWKAGEEK